MKGVLAILLPLGLFATTDAFAQNGCAPGTFSITSSPDGRAASVLFDDFSVTAGGGTGGGRSICNLRVPVTLHAGAVGVYKVDYRGFAFLSTGQSSELRIKHALGTDSSKIDGPFDGDISFSNTIGGGLSGTIDSQILLEVKSAAELEEALALLDSVDLAEIGFTTVALVEASMDRLAEQRAGVVTHLGTTADMLLGFTQPIDGPSNVGALAAAGSATIGANGRWNFDGGVSVLGGAAYVEQSAGGVEVKGSALFAGAIRYIHPGTITFRPFAEAGLWGSPDLGMHFSRAYLNGMGEGDASGSLIGVYGRGGVLYAPNPTNEIAFSGTLARNWLHVGTYSEPGGPGNLFPATFAAGTSTSDVAKATVAWTGIITEKVDFTLSAAVGQTFGGSGKLATNVDWIGGVTGTAGNFTFIEYGARLGWKVTRSTTLDAFVFGTAGDKIGSHAQFGGAVRVGF